MGEARKDAHLWLLYHPASLIPVVFIERELFCI